ncbi:branched-chain amino acid ABC transporter permease [Blastococcus sp. HT6-30]|uniref:branched-chain amino acid ABC transporter permease n=1 Tax=Blastococcus sp. HT6-30 TaxID=3144843 RepID=UPI0032193A6D
MDELLNILVLGITRGTLYALLALGFALIFSVARVINLAHGAYFMIGAYFSYIFYDYVLGEGGVAMIIIAVVVGALASGLIALFQFYVLLRGLKNPRHDYILVMSLALSLLAGEIFRQVFGAERATPPAFVNSYGTVFGVRVISQELIIVPVAVLAVVAMVLYLKYTRQGRSVVAVAQNRHGAVLMGIDPVKAFAIVFFLAGCTAGLSGALMGPIRVVDPLMWIPPLILSFAIVVMGGLGSLYGTIAGAFLVGLIETATALQIGAAYTELVAFVVIIAVLAIRPAGLFGKQVRL